MNTFLNKIIKLIQEPKLTTNVKKKSIYNKTDNKRTLFLIFVDINLKTKIKRIKVGIEIQFITEIHLKNRITVFSYILTLFLFSFCFRQHTLIIRLNFIRKHA